LNKGELSPHGVELPNSPDEYIGTNAHTEREIQEDKPYAKADKI
jgi:hypothetical protein